MTDTISSRYNIGVFNPFRYRGYVYDTDTGLYYLQSRYYDPVTGRFINADVYCDTQTGNPLSANMFAYCENNPISITDKSGEFGTPLQWVMAAVGGIAGWFLGDYVAKNWVTLKDGNIGQYVQVSPLEVQLLVGLQEPLCSK